MSSVSHEQTRALEAWKNGNPTLEQGLLVVPFPNKDGEIIFIADSTPESPKRKFFESLVRRIWNAGYIEPND